MKEQGYLEARAWRTLLTCCDPTTCLASYRHQLRAAKKPLPFDIFYWNSLRLPATNHSFICATALDNKHQCEMEIAASRRSTGDSAARQSRHPRRSHRPGETVLFARNFSASGQICARRPGHIAGVINPPDKPKYH
jgi:polyhydroxyalkanoate synthase